MRHPLVVEDVAFGRDPDVDDHGRIASSSQPLNAFAMNARYLSLALFLTATIASTAQQIINGGFEAWTNVPAYTTIDDWNSGNYQIPGTVTTTRVAGTFGQYAAHMETVAVGPDTTFGFILHGNFVNDIATQGVPFTTDIDAMEGWYRYDMMPGDSALIYLIVWKSGVIMDTMVHLVGGTQTTWTAFNLPVNGGIPVQSDSVVVAVVSSNPFSLLGMTPGSWIEVDALRLTATTVLNPDALPNKDMELWHDVITEEPDGWSTFNPLLAQLGLTPVTKDTMAHAGNYSVRMETMDIGNDTLPGLITNGDLFGGGFYSGMPYMDTPSLMTAFYQYAPVGVDTAFVNAIFIRNGLVLTSASFILTSTTSAWTFVGAPITLFTAPDTLVLQAWSGQNPGSVLHMDDLAFSGISTGIVEGNAAPMILYPQPASEVLNVVLNAANWNGASIRIVDRTGRSVHEQSASNMQGGSVALSVAHLAAGHYVLELRKGDRAERMGFVKE